MFTNDSCLSMKLAKSYATLEDFQKADSYNEDSLRVFILPYPEETETAVKLLDKYCFCRLYIHCTDELLDHFDRLGRTHPHRCFVYRKKEVLRYALNFDLSDLIVKLGDYHRRNNRIDLAQRRYRCARELRIGVQLVLKRLLQNL